MKTSKWIVMFMCMTLCCSNNLFAQDNAGNRPQRKFDPEKMIEWQTKQMEKKLILDDETSAKFAPLYKEYLNAIRSCFTNEKTPQAPRKDLTDEERDQRMQNYFNVQKKVIETKQAYYDKFKKILNVKQVELLFKEQNSRPKAPFRKDNNNNRMPRMPRN